MDALFRAGAPGWTAVSAFAQTVWSCDIDLRTALPAAASPVARAISSAMTFLAGGIAYGTSFLLPPLARPRAPPPSAAEASINRQATLLGVPSELIRLSLPLDTTSGVTFMPQLLESVGNDLDHFAAILRAASGAQEANIVISSASSGLGKTHMAYAWGVRHGFSILSRAITSDMAATIAPPFMWVIAQLQPFLLVPIDDAVVVSAAARLIVRLALLSFVHLSVLALQSLLATHPDAPADNRRQLLLRMHRSGNADALVTDILNAMLLRLRVKRWRVNGVDVFALDAEKMKAYEASLSTAVLRLMGTAILVTVDEAHELMERAECRAVDSLFLSQRADTGAGSAGGADAPSMHASRSRSLFYAIVCELSSINLEHSWSAYMTGTALSMRRIDYSSNSSLANRCYPVEFEFAPEHRLTEVDIASLLCRYWAIDDVLVDASVTELLRKFVGRPLLFVTGVFKPLFIQICTLRRLPTAAELKESLERSFVDCVRHRKLYFIDKLQRNAPVAPDGSGTMALIPMLFKAAVMNAGVITLRSDDPLLAYAICTGLLAVSSAQAGPVDMRDEPVIYEGMRSAMLDPAIEGRVLDVLTRSSRTIEVYAKGGALELAVSWHVALTCNRLPSPSLALVLISLGVRDTDIPRDLYSWVVRATRVRDDAQGMAHSGGAEPTPFQRYFVQSDGSIDDRHVIFNIPVEMGGDIAFIVSRIVPAGIGCESDGSDIFNGRQYRPVVLQCKNEEGATVAETLLTLHPGSQFLQNSTRKRFLHLPHSNGLIAAQRGWEKWDALARNAETSFLTRNWVRIAVISRPLDAAITAFSLAAAVSDTDDYRVLAWSAEQRRLAALSPVVWVSLANPFLQREGVFPESVRLALVPLRRRAVISLLHTDLWIPASVIEAAALLAAAAPASAGAKRTAGDVDLSPRAAPGGAASSKRGRRGSDG